MRSRLTSSQKIEVNTLAELSLAVATTLAGMDEGERTAQKAIDSADPYYVRI